MWKGKLLSQRRKEVFIKVVVLANPTFAVSCFKIPKALYIDLERLIANFW